MVKAAEIIQLMAKIAPASLAEDWDNVGMQVGDDLQEVKNILIALDFNREVLNEAVQKNCQMIITHHPFLFEGIKSINTQNESGRLIFELIKNNICLFSAHTNLDIADGGLNDYLSQKLKIKNTAILKVTKNINYYKLITYIPKDNLSEVKEALYEKGIGRYKNYSHCGFYHQGKGNFKALEGSDPYLGEKHQLNEVEEYRFESIVKEDNLDKVIKKLLKVHPYEEPAWDLFKMENMSEKKGIGRIGKLQEEIDLDSLIVKIKGIFQLDLMKVVKAKNKIKKIAICSGSGADFIKDAYYKGADLYLTGDVKYHEAQKAEELGMSLIDIGHYGSEKFVKELLFEKLQQKANKKINKNINFIISEIKTRPWDYK